MSKEIIIEDNKPQQVKPSKILLGLSVLISVIVIVFLILNLTKVVERRISMHIIYPGLALNILMNGITMLKVNNKKIAKFDFIWSALTVFIYIFMIILEYAV